MEYESNHLFDDYPFKLGGSSNLCGYSRESIQGDIYMLMNFVELVEQILIETKAAIGSNIPIGIKIRNHPNIVELLIDAY